VAVVLELFEGLLKPSKLLKVCFVGDNNPEGTPDPLNGETTWTKACINCFLVTTQRTGQAASLSTIKHQNLEWTFDPAVQLYRILSICD
jgi:hypothetical protein